MHACIHAPKPLSEYLRTDLHKFSYTRAFVVSQLKTSRIFLGNVGFLTPDFSQVGVLNEGLQSCISRCSTGNLQFEIFPLGPNP